MPDTRYRLSVLVCTAIICLQIGACASSRDVTEICDAGRSPADPWEPMNRALYRGTAALDRVTFKPLAKGYVKVIPGFIRTGITNFSKNLRSPLNIINHFLQGKPADGFKQTGRFLMNSTFGIVGLLDVAADAGIPQKNEDFGQTLAVWGVPDGPYIVIPFFGPGTFRDMTMLPLNLYADLLVHYDNSSVRDKLYLVRLVDLRARYLKIEPFVGDAYDPYIRVREAYLQRRQHQIYDGEPPEYEDPCDVYPEPE